MKPVVAFLSLVVASLLSCSLVSAAPGESLKDNPCAADIQKYCSDVTRGGGRVVACLKAHEDKLSPQCRASMEESKKKVREAIDSCKSDTQKFCANVKPGQGRVAACLKAHEDRLSPECRKTFEMAGKRKK